jgi:hypothetical protein
MLSVMKIIKIWYLHTEPADYRTDSRTGDIVHNMYCDCNDIYFYSGDEAMRIFKECADKYRSTWKKYGDRRVYPSDVCCMCALLVPVLDSIPLPVDANELFMYEVRYLDGIDAEGIVPEYELPQVGTYYTLFEDGEITEGDGSNSDPKCYISRWKAAGWDGKVDDVIQ